MASCPEYGKYADEVLAKQMDPEVLKKIRKLEEAGEFENPEYMGLLMPYFYNQHVCRLPMNEWPEPMLRSFGKLNNSLYVIMQGPSEFGIAGKLKNWDRSNDLSKLHMPTLVIGAQYDTMDPKYMEWMSKQMPKGKYLYCENGSHMCMYDDQATYMKGLITFLLETNK